jgi:CBS domain-containing protein
MKATSNNHLRLRTLVTVAPETPTLEALGMMRSRKIGCLPVIEHGRLVGIVTAYDFLALAAEVIENQMIDCGRRREKE